MGLEGNSGIGALLAIHNPSIPLRWTRVPTVSDERAAGSKNHGYQGAAGQLVGRWTGPIVESAVPFSSAPGAKDLTIMSFGYDYLPLPRNEAVISALVRNDDGNHRF